jgi:hypothetical protein
MSPTKSDVVSWSANATDLQVPQGLGQGVDDLVVVDPAEDPADDDGDGADGDAVAQLTEVIAERHPPLGVALASQ